MANKEVVKKLSIAELKKQEKKVNKIEEGFVRIGDEDYKFTYDAFFRKSKRIELIDELLEFIDLGIQDEEIMKFSTTYTVLLAIKHFTSIDVPDDINESMEFMNMLLDLEVFDKILNILPESELEKLYEEMTEVVENVAKSFEEQLAEILNEQKEAVDKDETE